MDDIIVKLPDGSEAHFPNGTSPETIQGALSAQFGNPQGNISGDTSGLTRLGQFGNAVNKGAAGMVDTALDLPQNLWNLGKAGLGVANQELGLGMPQGAFDTSQGAFATDANGQAYHPAAHLLQAFGGIKDEYGPQDLQGRLIDTAGQMVGGGGLNPKAIATGAASGLPALVGAIGKQAVPALGAAIGKETAYQIAPDSKLAQLAGALTGGIAGSSSAMLMPTISTTAKNILGNATPAQLDQARALMAGGRVTAPEALAYVTKSTMGPKLQRTLESTAGGGEVLSPYMAARTPQNEAKVASVMDQISPNMAVRNPYAAGTDVRDAAVGRIGQETQARTAAVNPFYKAAENDKLPAQDMADLATNIGTAAVKAGAQTDLGKALMGLYKKVAPLGAPETRVSVLDNIYKETRDKVALAPHEQNAMLKSVASSVGGQNRALGDALMTNPNISQGRAMYQDITNNKVAPLMDSPVGQLADMGDVNPQKAYEAAKSVLVPGDPKGIINPQQISFTAKELAKANPNAIPDFARQHIDATWKEANQYIRGETPQFTGARFAQAIAGNKDQADNLIALVRGASGDQAANGLESALTTMKAQSTRLGEGSPTALNQETMANLGAGGASQMFKPKAALNDFIDKVRLSKNSKELAEAITSPEGIQQLQDISKSASKRLGDVLKRGAMTGISATRDQSDALPASSSSSP